MRQIEFPQGRDLSPGLERLPGIPRPQPEARNLLEFTVLQCRSP